MSNQNVSHLNGYNIKDKTARNDAKEALENARLAKNDAEEAKRQVLQMGTDVESAKKTSAQAATAAKTAYNMANAALPKEGGKMEGNVDMNGHALLNAANLCGDAVILENKTGGGEVTIEALTTPGVVSLKHWKKPSPGDVIIRGIAKPSAANDVANKEYVDGKFNEARFHDWSGLKWYALGDSLTDPAGRTHTDKFYYEYIAEMTGIQVIVDGQGGTGYYAGVSTGTNFAERVKNIPDDVDIVTIFGSVNDVVHGYDNYASHISAAMGHIWNNRPGLPVIIVPPSPCKEYQKRGDDWKNYCDRIELCALNYDMRYVDDMFKCPPFNPGSDAQLQAFFNKDAEGIHPDENGHREIARYIYDAMLKELAFK